MAKRRIKSVKNELVKKSREAVLAAVQIYNNPQVTFKAESFISLAVIGWTYLLHAYYRDKKIDYRYYHSNGKKKNYDKTKYGAYKHWELERCLNCDECPLDKDTIANLRFLIGIRHEIEHQMTDKIDEYLSAKLQACAINFDYYITNLFGDKYNLSKELSLAIQFSPLSPEQQQELRVNTHITTNIQNFIVDFENELSEDSLKNSRYAYRVVFLPVNVNRKGQADKVVEFIKSDSPLAEGLEKTYALIKETERTKYLPSQIVANVKSKGYSKFSMTKHTVLWKSKNAKDKGNGYGVMVANTWYWYDSWLQYVLKYCEENRTVFI
ncbi:DUF3644 domain-containing protein [Anaerotignum sp.]|uniref:DUF3644 domain-containing protein n=1 Tax=Anaerotignum sp. TaxID=2039241 RepID=UPI0027151B4B|nr:DUF3644 domain-containing protein [Anaerotignum sp.]